MCVNVLAIEYGCKECVWLLIENGFLLWGQGPAFCYPGHFFSVSVCVSVCLCRCSGQPAHHNFFSPDSMER